MALGEATCPHCGHALPPRVAGRGLDSCPGCGLTLEGAAAAPARSTNVISAYFRTLFQILTHPTGYFQRMPVTGGVSGPMAFALVTHWIGSAISFLWMGIIAGTIGRYVDNLFKMMGDVADVDHPGRAAQMAQIQEQIARWTVGVGSVLVDPFLTLVRIVFTSCFVYIGAKLLVTPSPEPQGPREVSFESAVRVVCFGLTPAILSGVPLFGGLIAAMFTIIVTVIAAREVYRVGTGRALIIALFPKILFLAVLLLVLALIAFAAFKFLGGMSFEF